MAGGTGRLLCLPGEGPRAGIHSIWEGRGEGTAGSRHWASGRGGEGQGAGRAGRGWHSKVRMRRELYPRPGLGDKKKKTKAKPVIPKSLPSRLHLGEMSSEAGVGAVHAGTTGQSQPGVAGCSQQNWDEPWPRAHLPDPVLPSSLSPPITVPGIWEF